MDYVKETLYKDFRVDDVVIEKGIDLSQHPTNWVIDVSERQQRLELTSDGKTTVLLK